jgi:hypothetical protein
LLLVASCFWWASLISADGQSLISVYVDHATFALQYTPSDLHMSVVEVRRQPQSLSVLGIGLTEFDGQWFDNGGTFIRTLIFPLWVPMMAFGLWPAIVAAKARRRRRQQVRGFDVRPAENGAEISN